MIFLRKFYDDGAGDGGGGGDDAAKAAADAAAAQAAADAAKNTSTVEPLFSAEELKEMGYDSVEAAKEGLKGLVAKSKIVDPTEEEKKKAEKIEHADFLKYAAENDLVNEDFEKYESLKDVPDRSLVFNKFAAEFKEDNPEIPAEELEAATKEAFENEFHLNSTNAKEKSRGEARLSKEAKEMRAPAESAYNTAKENFKGHKEVMSKGKDFAKTFIEVISSVPDKLEVFKTTLKKDDKNADDAGEEVVVELELTKEEKTAAEKKFNTVKTFQLYLDAEKSGKLDEFKANLNKKIISFIKQSRESDILSTVADKVKGIGMKFGSDVGAGQPFAVVKGGGGEGGGVTKSAKEQVLDSTRKANNF